MAWTVIHLEMWPPKYVQEQAPPHRSVSKAPGIKQQHTGLTEAEPHVADYGANHAQVEVDDAELGDKQVGLYAQPAISYQVLQLTAHAAAAKAKQASVHNLGEAANAFIKDVGGIGVQS